LIKTMRNWKKENKSRFTVPRGVQDCIPIHSIFEDGIFCVRTGRGVNKYSKTFRFTDINYAVASKEDKERMFLDYSELINALDSGATAKLTVRARRLSKADLEAHILLPLTGDVLDKYRLEFNRFLRKRVMESNAIVMDKMLTITV